MFREETLPWSLYHRHFLPPRMSRSYQQRMSHCDRPAVTFALDCDAFLEFLPFSLGLICR